MSFGVKIRKVEVIEDKARFFNDEWYLYVGTRHSFIRQTDYYVNSTPRVNLNREYEYSMLKVDRYNLPLRLLFTKSRIKRLCNIASSQTLNQIDILMTATHQLLLSGLIRW